MTPITVEMLKKACVSFGIPMLKDVSPADHGRILAMVNHFYAIGTMDGEARAEARPDRDPERRELAKRLLVASMGEASSREWSLNGLYHIAGFHVAAADALLAALDGESKT